MSSFNPAQRVLDNLAAAGDTHLKGDPPLTPRQVSAVMHALADLTHQHHMLSDEVLHLASGEDLQVGVEWARANALGRYFHHLGDTLGDAQADASIAGGPAFPSSPHVRGIDRSATAEGQST